MKKTYIKPHTECVKVNLFGSVLDDGSAVGGQSHNPVSKPTDRGKISWGKEQTFTDDEEENPWGNGKTNLWDN